MITIEIPDDVIRKKRFKPSLMDMNVFHPRKAKVFKSKKDYRRKEKHHKGWNE